MITYDDETADRISAMRDRAHSRDDHALAELCTIALGGYPDDEPPTPTARALAWRECERRLNSRSGTRWTDAERAGNGDARMTLRMRVDDFELLDELVESGAAESRSELIAELIRERHARKGD